MKVPGKTEKKIWNVWSWEFCLVQKFYAEEFSFWAMSWYRNHEAGKDSDPKNKMQITPEMTPQKQSTDTGAIKGRNQWVVADCGAVCACELPHLFLSPRVLTSFTTSFTLAPTAFSSSLTSSSSKLPSPHQLHTVSPGALELDWYEYFIWWRHFQNKFLSGFVSN